MAVLVAGRWVGRPKAGDAGQGPTLENLIIRLRDNLEINEAAGCWEWTGAITRKGYGVIRVGKKNLLYIHRIMVELVRGRPLRGEECALHHCDNRRCGNPQHLFVGTHADNNEDMMAKGRSGLAKLTQGQTGAIRSAVAAGERPVDVAARYGVHRNTIGDVCRGRTWARIYKEGSPSRA